MQASTESAAPSRLMIVTTTENIPGTRVVKTIGQLTVLLPADRATDEAVTRVLRAGGAALRVVN